MEDTGKSQLAGHDLAGVKTIHSHWHMEGVDNPWDPEPLQARASSMHRRLMQVFPHVTRRGKNKVGVIEEQEDDASY